MSWFPIIVSCVFQVSGSGESDILWHIDDADISSIIALFAFKMCCQAATVAKLSTMCQRKNSTAKLISQDLSNLYQLARLKIWPGKRHFKIFLGFNLLLNAQLLELSKQKSATFRSEKAWVQNFHWFSNSSLKFYTFLATLRGQTPPRLRVNLLVRVPCLRSFSQNEKFSSLDVLWLKALLWRPSTPLHLWESSDGETCSQIGTVAMQVFLTTFWFFAPHF